jgi:FAD/FMN-containing dehydrogenase
MGGPGRGAAEPVEVNDYHSQLNATRVAGVVEVDSLAAAREAIAASRRGGLPVCIAGGRHAMGGQQFAEGALLLDTTRLNRVLGFDMERGTVEVEAGIQWPALVRSLLEEQEGRSRQWGIIQKQTGADALSLGGALASNIHSRGLAMRPIIADVEGFTLLDAEGRLHHCSRGENSRLFRLAIGGYGLFGFLYSVTLRLRLRPRHKVQRVVEIIRVEDLIAAFEERIRQGFLYGDFQYSTDELSEDYLRIGIFPAYRPVPPETPIPEDQKTITEEEWNDLVYYGHVDKARSYRLYSEYYLASSGQIYWSDTHQLIPYQVDYHKRLDRRMGAEEPATEMIAELLVPRPALAGFMESVREDFLKNGVNVVYGTIRLIERDDESFLSWAREPYVCIIFNLHVVHTPEGIEHSRAAFRRLIGLAIRQGGSYYLTYHRWATREQLLACYPQFPEFLRLKREHDPEERFQSEWYRHYRALLSPDA